MLTSRPVSRAGLVLSTDLQLLVLYGRGGGGQSSSRADVITRATLRRHPGTSASNKAHIQPGNETQWSPSACYSIKELSYSGLPLRITALSV